MLDRRLILLPLLATVALCSEAETQVEVGAEAAKTFDYKTAHKLFMLYGWTVVADVTVLLAFYQHRRYAKIIHTILGFGLIATTLSTSIPFLIKNGISSKRYVHYVMGVAIYGVMGLQLFLGVIKFGFIFFNKGNSFSIYIFKIIHKYLGYSLVITCKIQIFLILSKQRTEYSTLIGWEIAVALTFFYRLFTYAKLTATILPDLYVKKRISKFSQIQQENKNFVIFGNYVYNLEPLKIGHPAGYKIVDAIQNQSADKYMYGIYTSEVQTRIPRYSHSQASLKVLSKPEAMIDIPSPYQGFEKDIVKVKAVHINEISKHVYQIRLIKDEGFNFTFKGFSEAAQIGRFYSLTVDNELTRLYTSVNFITKKNKDLLKAVYFNQKNLSIDYEDNTKTQGDLFINETTIENQENQLPLLIKQYKKGHFTKLIHLLKEKTLHLSSERGFGLSLGSLEPGRVVIAIGGTGIYPFCDLIDLLFKDCLRKQVQPRLADRVNSENPILLKQPFDRLTFQFLGSFHCLEDIHKITLHQILYLCKHRVGFKFLFRIKKKIPQDKVKQMGIDLTKEIFQQLLSDVIMKDNLSKLWVCGPPRMNSSIRQQVEKMLTRNQFQFM